MGARKRLERALERKRQARVEAADRKPKMAALKAVLDRQEPRRLLRFGSADTIRAEREAHRLKLERRYARTEPAPLSPPESEVVSG